MAFFAVAGLRAQASALHSGGQRKLALPDTGPDPTDAATSRDALLARRREVVPERRLVVAVLMATLEDLERHPVDSKAYGAAWRWLMADDEAWPFAFRPVCDTLGLDADAVRRRLRATVARRAPAPAVPTIRLVHGRRGRPPVLVERAAS